MKTRKELLNSINIIAVEALMSNQNDIYKKVFILLKDIDNSKDTAPENYRVPVNMYANKSLSDVPTNRMFYTSHLS